MDSFREYKSFKSEWKSKKRIPILRVLFVLILLYAGYASGIFYKAYSAVENFFRHEEEKAYIDVSWREGCSMTTGEAFVIKKKFWGGCAWTVPSSRASVYLPDNPFLRYLASVPGTSYPLKIYWIADTSDFWNPGMVGVKRDSLLSWYYHFRMEDSSFAWVTADGCRYPGACPRNPLSGGALPIPDDFDFHGRENLLLKDLFMGIGEAPVFPILPARILSVSEDSLGYKLFLDHGGNLFSRISGLPYLKPNVVVGAQIESSEPIGSLSPKDESFFFLEVLRNGRFVRWDEFYRETHLVEECDVERFRMDLGI